MKNNSNAYAALRVPDYRRFLSMRLFSVLAIQIMSVSVGYYVYDLTGDPLMLGLLGLAEAIPAISISLWAGHLADKHNRRNILAGCLAAMLCCALALVTLAVQGDTLQKGIVLSGIYTVIFVTGIARGFFSPTNFAFLPQLVNKQTLPNAITWNSSMFQIAAVAGPLLAGLIIARFNHAWPVYAISALLCAIFAITTLGLKPIAHHAAGRGKMSFSGMLDGLSHLWKERTIFAAITLDLFAVLLGGAVGLMPIFASEILNVGPVGLGWLRAAPFIGSGLMALYLAWHPLIRRAGPAMLLSIAGFGVCTIVFGFSTNFWLSIVMLFTLGALDSVSVVVRHVLVQLRTPRHLRGRVSAVNSVFIECSNELGSFESGLVAKLAPIWFGLSAIGGVVFSVVSGGIGTILVVAGVAWFIPEIRRLDKLHDKPFDLAEDAGK